jgi:hypothetical protein
MSFRVPLPERVPHQMPGWRHWQVDVPLISEGEDFAIKAISAIADSFTAEAISGIVAVRLWVEFFAVASVRNVKKRKMINDVGICIVERLSGTMMNLVLWCGIAEGVREVLLLRWAKAFRRIFDAWESFKGFWGVFEGRYVLNELPRESVARSEICQKFVCWRTVEIEAFTPRHRLATKI